MRDCIVVIIHYTVRFRPIFIQMTMSRIKLSYCLYSILHKWGGYVSIDDCIEELKIPVYCVCIFQFVSGMIKSECKCFINHNHNEATAVSQTWVRLEVLVV